MPDILITKKSRLLSLVLSMGLLLSMAVSGCTDKDRDHGEPTPVPGTTTKVYVNVGALDLAYDALYCTINSSEDVDGEESADEPADEAFLVEVNEDGLGLIAENQEVGSPISFTLSFQLEGKEVATYEAKDVIVNPEDEDSFIIVVDEVVPVSDDEFEVYVNIADVKVGHSKVVLKGEEEDTELEFDENGLSTTPVTTVKEGEKAKFCLSFIQNQSDITKYIGSAEPPKDLEYEDVEIATYDVTEEGVEVNTEEEIPTVAIDEVAIVSPSCLSFDMSALTASKEYHGSTIGYAVIMMIDVVKMETVTSEEELLKCINANAIKVQPNGTGFLPISMDGLDKSKYICTVMFLSSDDLTQQPIAQYSPMFEVSTSEVEAAAPSDMPTFDIDEDLVVVALTDDDLHEYNAEDSPVIGL